MRTFLKDSVNYDAVSPAGGTVSGNFYLIGVGIFGCAVTDSVVGDIVSLRRLGHFTGVPKDTAAAWAAGDILYWDNAAKKFTKTVGSNTRVGYAGLDALIADTTGDVLLDGHVA